LLRRFTPRNDVPAFVIASPFANGRSNLFAMQSVKKFPHIFAGIFCKGVKIRENLSAACVA